MSKHKDHMHLFSAEFSTSCARFAHKKADSRQVSVFWVLQAEMGLVMSAAQLGCRQVVRHRFLVSAFPGSNPGTPATFHCIVCSISNQKMHCLFVRM